MLKIWSSDHFQGFSKNPSPFVEFFAGSLFFGQDPENENFSLIVECYYGLDIFSNRASHTYTNTQNYISNTYYEIKTKIALLVLNL